MAISLQIYNLLSNLPKNYQKKMMTSTNMTSHRKIYSHAETLSSHRDFIVPLPHSSPHPSKGRGPGKGGGVD